MSCVDVGSWPKGSRPVVTYNFVNTLGAAFDPTDIDVTVKDPSGDQTTYDDSGPEIFQAGTPVTGEWFFAFPANLTEVGTWFIYVNGDGAVLERSFKITGVHVTV